MSSGLLQVFVEVGNHHGTSNYVLYWIHVDCKIVKFAVPADHRIKLKESEKKGKYLDLVRELKKTMEPEGVDYTNRDWCFQYSN